MKTLIISFIFLTLISTSNRNDIIIDKAGDNWDYQVHDALNLIKKTDINSYNKLNNVCHKSPFGLVVTQQMNFQMEKAL